MIALIYDGREKTITCGDEVYSHFSGGEVCDEIVGILVKFDLGDISLQDAWLMLKHLQDSK